VLSRNVHAENKEVPTKTDATEISLCMAIAFGKLQHWLLKRYDAYQHWNRCSHGDGSVELLRVLQSGKLHSEHLRQLLPPTAFVQGLSSIERNGNRQTEKKLSLRD